MSTLLFTMEFYISVQSEKAYVRLKVEMYYQSDQIEKYRVIARNRTIVMQTNSPLLRRNLVHRKPDWKMVEGELQEMAFLLCLAIDE